MRLLEMQRKLSAIAEIPKILTSTLATVSQSFGRMSESEGDDDVEAYVQRKFSYDEDALDFELRDDGEQPGDTDSDEDDLVQVEEDEDEEEEEAAASEGVRQSKLLKDVTPESDYASEANYPSNEASDDTASEDEQVYFIKLPAAPAEDSCSLSEDEDELEDDNDSDSDSDFLSTTYTWNLRNVPKVRINDAEADGELTLGQQKIEFPKQEPCQEKEESQPSHLEPEQAKVRPATPTPQAPNQDFAEGQTQKLLFRLDKLERSWPWADREKIIYKQSTCHLVPRKPLGLVGQRMQLLLKDRKE